VTGTETTPRIRPRIRAAAVVWGIVIVVSAVAIGWFVLDPARVTAVGLTLATADAGTLAFGVVGLLLVVGVVIVIGSVLSVVHRAQDRARVRREEPTATSPAPEPGAADRT
jgi:uncharacterized membrane protein